MEKHLHDSNPTINVRLGKDGRPLGAAAVTRFDRPIADVWAAAFDIESYARHLPMVHRVHRRGDDVTFDLKFRLGLFSAGFQFSTAVTHEQERWLEMRWIGGEPRGIRLRFGLTPLEEGKACLVEGDVEFDPASLGWLAKYFLKHHPEIQFGVFPGVALVLIDALRGAVAARDVQKT